MVCLIERRILPLQYLPLVEVIALTHLDAVKDMIASVDHGLVVLVDELTSWIYLAMCHDQCLKTHHSMNLIH